jgi:NAD(P)-dependent dehydrogenase (short-subunit alcohol dehydrogenase family)
VNAILPGMVEGDRIRRVIEGKAQAKGQSFAEVEKAALANVSLHTMVTAQQLADQILFLCSPRGRTISGQAISVCGDTLQLI